MKTNWINKANEGAGQRAANEHHAHERMQRWAAMSDEQAADALNATRSIDLPNGATVLESRESGDLVRLSTGQRLRRWTAGLSTDAFRVGGIGWDRFGDHADEMGAINEGTP